MDHARIRERLIYLTRELDPQDLENFNQQLEETLKEAVELNILKVDAFNADSFGVLQDQLQLIFTTLNLGILTTIDCALKAKLQAQVAHVIAFEGAAVSMRNLACVINYQPGTYFPTLSHDLYHYMALQKEKAMSGMQDRAIIESIVFRTLQQDQALLMYDEQDKFTAGGSHVMVLKQVQHIIGEETFPTHYYGEAMSFANYAQQALNRSIQRLKVGEKNFHGFVNSVSRDPDFLSKVAKRAEYCRSYMAFLNGVYVLPEDKFYGNAQKLPFATTLLHSVPRTFHTQDFDYASYDKVTVSDNDFLLCKCDGTQPCNCTAPAIMAGIPTPALDQICDTQKWPVGVKFMMYAIIGRSLYDLKTTDDALACLPGFWGVAGSGKSTLTTLIQNILSTAQHITGPRGELFCRSEALWKRWLKVPTDEALIKTRQSMDVKTHVGVLESHVEPNFPLSGVYRSLAVVVQEVKRGTNLPAASMLKMVGGENTSISIKNKLPVQQPWAPPVYMCMNRVPDIFIDTNNEWHRRVVIWLFEQKVKNADQGLEKKLSEEITRIIIKLNRIYLAWVKFCKKRTVYPENPDDDVYQPHAYFMRTRTKFFSSVSLHIAFVEEYLQSGMFTVTNSPADFVDVSLIKQHYGQYKLQEGCTHTTATRDDAEAIVRAIKAYGVEEAIGDKREKVLTGLRYNPPPPVLPSVVGQ
jgi:hypothetical protein